MQHNKVKRCLKCNKIIQDVELHKRIFDGYEGKFEENQVNSGSLSVVYQRAKVNGAEELQKLIYYIHLNYVYLSSLTFFNNLTLLCI